MDLLNSLLASIVGAIVGVVTTYFLQIGMAIARARKGEDISGIWISSYQIPSEDGRAREWSTDYVDIRRGRGKFKIVSQPESKDPTEAEAMLTTKRQLVGTWRTRTAGSTMGGAFVLVVSASGRYIYGFFTGLGYAGTKGVSYWAWVLAKSYEDLVTAKEFLDIASSGMLPAAELQNSTK